MTNTAEQASAICAELGGDRSRLLDVLLALRQRLGHIDAAAIDVVATRLGVPRVDVAGVLSFYTFLGAEARGRIVIRLCDDVPDRMAGAERVGAGLEEELGIRFGETTPDGRFSLEWASCIGMSDQAPAALFNDVVVPNLGPGAARRLVRELREHPETADLRRILVREYGDGKNSHDLVRAAVKNNIRRAGEVILAERGPEEGLRKALAMSPAEVIREVKTARLRGRGGAGFPTGMKWEFTRAGDAGQRYLICNADEGEPGTFKDRVILTERPELLFEGMTIAAYAIGASRGLLYLRGEYAYLRPYLEHVLAERRAAGLLGRAIRGRAGFDFDIRIQMGAGAYVCGEETALISSCEGLRGDPKNRPPFPAQRGYLGHPTSVNNVETLCCVPRILEMGSGWFASLGSRKSTGTKLLSISGDCTRRGVYEVVLGTPLRAVLGMCGADEPAAVQVGGPSGRMVGPGDFERAICFDDLATGGALVVFGPGRDLLAMASQYLAFFIHESCGYCTPCRVGNVLLKERLDRILAGRGEADDLGYLEALGRTVKTASRCGLGQTSPNPVLSTLESFRPAYEARLRTPPEGTRAGFDVAARLAEASEMTGRAPVLFESGRDPL
ncbi:MAG: NADH:ubiquinone oxidoreductase [Thermoanaerobaculia bacterium]|nr:MAG: NADH:ubiquinone oxidoreductase [Thermoanaerobaculia bacterium]